MMDEYLACLHRDKSLYYRDNLTYIDSHHGAFSEEIMHRAFDFCLHKSIYNATILIEVAETLQKQSGEKPVTSQEPSLVYTQNDYNIIPEKTDINVFNTIYHLHNLLDSVDNAGSNVFAFSISASISSSVS